MALSCALFCSPLAFGQIIITGRFSEVWYHSVNLTNGTPPPTAFITSTSLTEPFGQSISTQFDHFTVTGAHNTGNLLVSQNTAFSSTSVFSDVSQSALTTTDFDDPAIYTRSVFYLDFVVPQPTDVTVAGFIIGSSIVGHADFARVELIQDFGPIFNTAFTPFPFMGTLYPNHNYRIEVVASGYSAYNDSTNSRAVATFEFTAVPEPSAMALCLTGLGTMIPFLVRRTRVTCFQKG
jgi:hypothetical protein